MYYRLKLYECFNVNSA